MLHGCLMFTKAQLDKLPKEYRLLFSNSPLSPLDIFPSIIYVSSCLSFLIGGGYGEKGEHIKIYLQRI